MPVCSNPDCGKKFGPAKSKAKRCPSCRKAKRAASDKDRRERKRLDEQKKVDEQRQQYERRKDKERSRQAEQSRRGQDCGPIPAVADQARKDSCRRDLKRFLLTYFPHNFALPFSPDHHKIIAKIEAAVLTGALSAYATPRGFGKTTITERAAIWGGLYGHVRFEVLLGATSEKGQDILETIKSELETNDLMAADFPEVCHPIRCLENIANRCKGQHVAGVKTRMKWGKQRIVLPTVRINGVQSPASSCVIHACGLLGALRGMKFQRPDGSSVRPDFVMPDDPQTDESANSDSQSEKRERLIAGAVLGLAGPGKTIAGLMPCTVIRPGDMVDRVLDHAKHPRWQGERTKTLYAFPIDDKLWEKYAELRREGLHQGDGGKAATEFYGAHREAMDAGAIVAWPERFLPGELSGLQSAMNVKIDAPEVFAAEYQNDPIVEGTDLTELTPDQICAKLYRMPRGLVPANCTHLSGFVDVQASLLFYAIAAWEPDFTGYLVDYGTFPGQNRNYFTLRDAQKTLLNVTKASGQEAAIYAGLEALVSSLAAFEWKRDGGGVLKVGRMLVDANWGDSTQIVYQFCRQSPHAAVLFPSHGKGIGASGTPMDQWPKREGEFRGLNWRVSPSDKMVRKVTYDTNWWKSFLHSRLAVGMGGRGCLSLWGERPEQHRMLADHLTAEYRVKTFGRGREVDEWRPRVEHRDNHYLDCAVGACVAASILGVTLGVTGDGPRPKPKRMSLGEMREQARQKRGA